MSQEHEGDNSQQKTSQDYRWPQRTAEELAQDQRTAKSCWGAAQDSQEWGVLHEGSEPEDDTSQFLEGMLSQGAGTAAEQESQAPSLVSQSHGANEQTLGEDSQHFSQQEGSPTA